MKRILFIILVFSGFYFNTEAQSTPYRVVIDVTSPDTMVHHMVMRWVNGISSGDPEAEIIVVFYAGALGMAMDGKSVVQDGIASFSSASNVHFRVCEMSLKRNKVDKDQLISGVTTVPDAIYEIISRQAAGWGYIKAAR